MKHTLLLLWSWLVPLATAWLPDCPMAMRIRGWLLGRSMKSCGKDFQVAKGAILRSLEKISVGDHVYIANGAWLAGGGSVELGDEVMLAPYTVLVSGNHTRQGRSYRFGKSKPLPIRVERGAWIGAHAVLVGGVSVGQGSLVAAGAVVTKDVPADTVVGGVPARIIRSVQDTPDVHELSSPIPLPEPETHQNIAAFSQIGKR